MAWAAYVLLGAAAHAAAPAVPAPDFSLADAAVETEGNRERICLNGAWQFYAGDVPFRAEPDAADGELALLIDDFEAGTDGWDAAAAEGTAPAELSAGPGRVGRGMTISMRQPAADWRTVSKMLELPEGEIAVTFRIKSAGEGPIQLSCRLLENHPDDFEIYQTERITVDWSKWAKVTIPLSGFPYYWGSGSGNDQTMQRDNINQFGFELDKSAAGSIVVDEVRVERLPPGHVLGAPTEWGAARVPGRVEIREFDCWLPDGTKLGGPPHQVPTTAWYRREIQLRPQWRGKRILLDVGYVNRRGDVYFNSAPIGGADRVIDVTDLCHWDEPNELLIHAWSTRQGADWWNHMSWSAGIYGDVWLEARQASVYVTDALIRTSVKRGTLTARATLANVGERPVEVTVDATAELRSKDPDAPDVPVPSATVTVPARGEAQAELAATSDKWALWSPEHPRLYDLAIRVRRNDGKVLDEMAERFGFREIEAHEGSYYLNGVPIELRFETSDVSGNLYTGWSEHFRRRYLQFLKGMNYNGLGVSARRGINMELLASLCDEMGMMWLPGWDSWSEERYKLLKNHPSLIGWSTDTWDTLYPWRMQPEMLGTDYFPAWLQPKRERILERERELRALDPTRLWIHYGDGNIGNTLCTLPYMGFGTPLQEREEFPRAWAQSKRKCLYFAEFDFPFMFSFRDVDAVESNRYEWNESFKSSLHLEHTARYFGQAAYGMSDDLLVHFFNGRDGNGDVSRAVKAINALWIRNTLRAWRTYGVSGLGPFGLTGGGYAHVVSDFSGHSEEAPAWDNLKTPGPKPEHFSNPVPFDTPNELHDVLRDAFSPVLVYIGGYPDFAAKDHTYWSGETIRKQIVVANHSEQAATVSLEGLGKRSEVTVPPGQVQFVPAEVTAPEVSERTQQELRLRAAANGEELPGDVLRVQIFPRAKRLAVTARLAIFDPGGDSRRVLKAAGVGARPVGSLEKIGDADVLIIGRGALTKEIDPAPLLEAVRQGLSVLCFEQEPDGLLAGALDTTYQRYAFPNLPEHPALRGIGQEDLINWRGETGFCEARPAPDPQTERSDPEEFWHWGNLGIVATHTLLKPHLGNARAIVHCGYDLERTPLLEAIDGRGRIVFCQLDVTPRYRIDPPATLIVNNLLEHLDDPVPEAQPVVYIGDDDGAALLDLLGYEHTTPAQDGGLPPGRILVVGSPPDDPRAVADYVSSGGHALCLAQAADELGTNWLPFEVTGSAERVGRALLDTVPTFMAGLGNSDFYWREPYEVVTLPHDPQGRLVRRFPHGAGAFILCQVDPLHFRHVRESLSGAATTTYPKALRVVNTLLQNLGARSDLRISLRPVTEQVTWVPLVADEFGDGVLPARWQAVSGQWDVQAGALHTPPGKGSDATGGRKLGVLDVPVSDFRLEADVRAVGENRHFLVVIDYQDPRNYYFLQFGADGFFFANIEDGGWARTVAGPQDPSVRLNDDEVHHVAVECIGTVCRVFFDGDRVFEKTGLVRKRRIEHGVAQSNGRVGFGSYYFELFIDNVVLAEDQRTAGARTVPGRHTPVDISAACNRSLTDDKAGDGRGGWFDSGEADLRLLPTGEQVMGGVKFRIIPAQESPDRQCIVLYGRRDPGLPKLAEVQLNGRKARTVYFLHASGYGGEHLATYSIVYEDGQRHDVPVRTDVEVGDWYEPFGQPWGGGSATRLDPKVCALGWEGPTPKFASAGLYVFPVVNPHPDRPINHIELSTPGTEQGQVGIVAITLSDGPPQTIPITKKAAGAQAVAGEFEDSPLYPRVVDLWHYNVDKYKQW